MYARRKRKREEKRWLKNKTRERKVLYVYRTASRPHLCVGRWRACSVPSKWKVRERDQQIFMYIWLQRAHITHFRLQLSRIRVGVYTLRSPPLWRHDLASLASVFRLGYLEFSFPFNGCQFPITTMNHQWCIKLLKHQPANDISLSVT